MEKFITSANHSCILPNGREACYHNGTSTLISPDVVERDSRNGGIRYLSSIYNAPRPMFLTRSPVMDNEKDMTRTPTTPKSPPAPVTPSTALSSHDPKAASQNTGVLPRGAHPPPYRGASSSSSKSSSLSSTSSESGGNSHGGTGAQPPRLSYPATSAPTGYSASGGGGIGMGSEMKGPQSYPEYPFHHHGQHGIAGGVPLHGDAHHYYRTSGDYLLDPCQRLPPLASRPGAVYNQPAQAFSTYPSDYHHQNNYSRTLSTGSLSSVSTAPSRPGFSSLDEFPTMYDHRSTFAPQDGTSQHHQYGYGAGATYGGSSSQANPYHYQRFYDYRAMTSSSVGADVGSPMSPPSSCDEHQPLLSLPQQNSCLGEYTSDEMGGQLSDEVSRTLNLRDQQRAASKVQQGAREQQQRKDIDVNCIHILEHPKDTEVFPNEKAVLRCVAKIIGERCQSEVEQKDEQPNLLWYKDDVPLVGELDSECVVDEVTEKDVGLYYCLVTHPGNERIQRQSKMAKLTIRKREEGRPHQSGSGSQPEANSTAPEILKQPPKAVSAVIDEKLQIPLKAAGIHLSFRWYKDNKELRYAEGPVLVIPSARYSDSGVYCCSISNEFGSVLSNNSLVKVTRVRDSKGAGGPSSKRPTSLYDWEDQPLTDAFLRDVGATVARQTLNLNRIGLYLGLRNEDIVEINQHFHIPEEQAFHMLRLWRKRGERERSTLKIILTQAGIKLDLLTARVPKKLATARPPRIVVHPNSTRVIYGCCLNLNVQVDPIEPLFDVQYQWYRNNKPLVGKTSQNIAISSASMEDAGEYYCLVSNHSAKTLSNVAKVEVINPHTTPGPLPSKPPSSMPTPPTTAATSLAFFNSSSSGYQHQKAHWTGHQGRYNTSTRAPQPVPQQLGCHGNQQPMGGDIISRGGSVGNQVPSASEGQLAEEDEDQLCGQPVLIGWDKKSIDTEASEKAATAVLPSQQPLSDRPQLQIVEHPKSQQVEAGDPLTLTCTAVGGTGQLSYTWYFNGLSLTGENRPKYEINCFTDEDEGLYQCKVLSGPDELMSRMAHIQMKDEPSD